MSKQRSIVYLLIYLAALLALRSVVSSTFPNLPESATELWFTSGLLLIVLGVLVTEKYFTRSLDVVVNALTVIVVLETIDVSSSIPLISATYTYAIVVGSMALLGFYLSSEDRDPQAWHQQLAAGLYRVTSFFGSARMMFSAMFAFSLFGYFLVNVESGQSISSQEWVVLSMISFWASALLVEPFDRNVVSPLARRFVRKQPRKIGRIVRRHEPNVVMASKLRDAATPLFGDLALVHEESAKPHAGVVAMYLDDVDTDDGRLLEFYVLGEQASGRMPGTSVSVTTVEQALERLTNDSEAVRIYENRDLIVGTIAAHSDIDVIRVRMLEGIDQRLKLSEGDLLTTSLYGQQVKYQIIGVNTEVETVAGQNKAGAKYITAQQIGEWDSGRQKFVSATWVPDVNAVVCQESVELEALPTVNDHSFRVGFVPKSLFPVYVDFDETVSHHLAIIGKTGTGKSFMAARIVEGLAGSGYKVVILEVDRKHPQSLSKRISAECVSPTSTTWTSKVEKRTRNNRTIDETVWSCKLDLSAADGKRVFVVDLDEQAKDMDGGPLSHAESAAAVIKEVLVHKAKPENANDKICIVMEEAYDFIPESTFGSQDFGQPSVSRIAQLVLKCRKHEVGFLVITQRTALVSKTILYQCNTIIALQTFDETSKTFMSAYINHKYLESMSILPRFRAIVVGKGSSCDKPIIVDFEAKD